MPDSFQKRIEDLIGKNFEVFEDELDLMDQSLVAVGEEIINIAPMEKFNKGCTCWYTLCWLRDS
jgi:hypothetical protein